MKEHLSGILDELCDTTELLFALAAVEVVLLLFAVAGMVYLEPGSPGFVVWVLNAAGLLVLLAISVPLIIICFRR